ncbi:3-isopropylmalate dehydratase small subunit [Oceanospirillaceae bacterium]|jgi:3-isopropylmalate/(R)-2-methylmalate dehydratase small subunit|nr:3-isopropylmalate dehydratase small subunit [Oceanospirillaceae bacterium]MDA9279611.1 3-isopropylmalate dehydratase small subunit [bacterium]MBT4997852.1 3-isopropylmalate dehydratase small subunit [Oceanospirillaceae bacterium]MBT6100085.1 3-isopropylmalate dehydratase small subunit [Oceanospirillaceae bacterium]MBT7672929.1 3-isopropylmalate dehydratase small subunit [Oceanospirillaceae bacterium]
MQSFTQLTGIAVPLDRANVDTDMIIPKQFLKSIKRSGFGPNLFDELRYLDEGQPDQDSTQRPINHDFVLNYPRYQGAKILLARQNFGCGSSREHAPWALLDFGLSCVIAPSFADIFYNNCFKNGILPITLLDEQMDQLFEDAQGQLGFELTVDLEAGLITGGSAGDIAFTVDSFRRHCLLHGLDDIGLTLEKTSQIKRYEQKRQQQAPWLFV